MENPQLYSRLRLQIFSLLKRVTDDIDRDIGLLPAGPPAPASGMEEQPLEELVRDLKLLGEEA